MDQILIANTMQKLSYPDFFLSWLNVTDECKYLGRYICTDLSDDRDIYRQCRMLYGQGNMLTWKFGACSPPVKTKPFKAYCTPMYTAYLWRHYKKSSMHRLNVAYNDGLRMLLRVPWWSTASYMPMCPVPTCLAVLRRLMYSCMCRLTDSVNSIILALTNPVLSSVQYLSKMWTHWRLSLVRKLPVCTSWFVRCVRCFFNLWTKYSKCPK